MGVEHVVYRGGRFPKEIEDCRDQVKTVEIEAGVDKIDDMAFFCFTGIVKLYIPPSVKAIGNQVFVGCEKLEKVHIPDTVTSLGENVFLRCKRLRTLSLPPTIQKIGKAMCKKCQDLESVRIPGRVESIGDHAFEGCTSLKTVIIPESVVSIGKSAFEGCSLLDLSVSEKASMGTIGSCAFAGTYKVTFVCSSLGKVRHAFGANVPIVQVRAPEKPVDRLRAFLKADNAEAVMLNFYKLRISLGLEAVAKGPALERYNLLRDKVLPLCSCVREGKTMYEVLDRKMGATARCPQDASTCIVGGGPVGIRAAIELATLGHEVTVVEHLTTTEICRRPGMPATMKWSTTDLHALGISCRDNTSQRHSRTASNPTPPNQRQCRAGSVRTRHLHSTPLPLRPGIMSAVALEVGLMRIALVLGVRFFFGSSFITAEALPSTKGESVSRADKRSVNMDISHGLKATLAEGSIGRGGLSKLDFFLATFGIAVREGSSVQDIVNSRCFRTLLAVNCHVVVGTDKISSRGSGSRGSVRLSQLNADCLAQAFNLSRKALQGLSLTSPPGTP